VDIVSKHGHGRLCWLTQKRAEKWADTQRSKARETEPMSLVTRTPLALEISHRDLTNRVTASFTSVRTADDRVGPIHLHQLARRSFALTRPPGPTTLAPTRVQASHLRESGGSMSAHQADGWTRRRFLGGLAMAGTAGLLSSHPSRARPRRHLRPATL
jgi:hypothetical protein